MGLGGCLGGGGKWLSARELDRWGLGGRVQGGLDGGLRGLVLDRGLYDLDRGIGGGHEEDDSGPGGEEVEGGMSSQRKARMNCHLKPQMMMRVMAVRKSMTSSTGEAAPSMVRGKMTSWRVSARLATARAAAFCRGVMGGLGNGAIIGSSRLDCRFYCRQLVVYATGMGISAKG